MLCPSFTCRIPLPTWGCVLMLLPATILLLYVLVLPFIQLSWPTMLATVGAILLGSIMYPMLQVRTGNDASLLVLLRALVRATGPASWRD